jgi:hypothetical protein
MKYKVGQIVIVQPRIKDMADYFPVYVDAMLEYVGQMLRINYVGYNYYHLQGNNWQWPEEVLCLPEEMAVPLHQYHVGDLVVVRSRVPGVQYAADFRDVMLPYVDTIQEITVCSGNLCMFKDCPYVFSFDMLDPADIICDDPTLIL